MPKLTRKKRVAPEIIKENNRLRSLNHRRRKKEYIKILECRIEELEKQVAQLNTELQKYKSFEDINMAISKD